ncbi:hypothetical protein I316_07330 [Kwoniella heveanensis BCC8398]|uniref:Zn(2)-C6 fungal-type domain-containing protein n=1 Tax=Kwoniella heveanensis BCC8398 TaxID=1296120 RepID=A0A1B9GJ42_9TREE|nr:hypothetical protein I316_07330 [Kwoniella heveanensis BCC8398]
MDLLFQFDNQPVAEASRSTPPKQPNKRLRTRRACDYCREHRIRCEYYDASETGACAHCENFGIPCQKIAEAPPDERPRAAKVMKTGAKEDLKGQSASPRNPTFNIAQEHTYLGPTSFSQQVHHHFSSTPLALDQLLAAEEKLGLASDVFQWAKGTGFLLGAGSQAATPLPSVSSPSTRPARASSVSSFSRANDRLADEIGGVTMINHCKSSSLPRMRV